MIFTERYHRCLTKHRKGSLVFQVNHSRPTPITKHSIGASWAEGGLGPRLYVFPEYSKYSVVGLWGKNDLYTFLSHPLPVQICVWFCSWYTPTPAIWCSPPLKSPQVGLEDVAPRRASSASIRCFRAQQKPPQQSGSDSWSLILDIRYTSMENPFYLRGRKRWKFSNDLFSQLKKMIKNRTYYI